MKPRSALFCRRAEKHHLFTVLVDGRLDVTRVDIVRVINSGFDFFKVQTPRDQVPISLIVRHQDRDGAAGLLSRAFPNVGGPSGFSEGRSISPPSH